VAGLVTAAPTFAFSVRRILCAPPRLDARFAVLCLREALALFEAVFVARDVVFAARPRALPPRPDLDALAGDLGAVVFAGVLLRDAAVLDTVFLEASGFSFLDAGVFFAAGRPRALTPRPDLVVFGDLAIHNSFKLGFTCTRRASAVTATVGKGGGGVNKDVGAGCVHGYGSLRRAVTEATCFGSTGLVPRHRRLVENRGDTQRG
jgi:hypothetical protein